MALSVQDRRMVAAIVSTHCSASAYPAGGSSRLDEVEHVHLQRTVCCASSRSYHELHWDGQVGTSGTTLLSSKASYLPSAVVELHIGLDIHCRVRALTQNCPS